MSRASTWCLVISLNCSHNFQSKQCKHIKRHSVAYSVVKVCISKDTNIGGLKPCWGHRFWDGGPWFLYNSTSLICKAGFNMLPFEPIQVPFLFLLFLWCMWRWHITAVPVTRLPLALSGLWEYWTHSSLLYILLCLSSVKPIPEPDWPNTSFSTTTSLWPRKRTYH